MTSFPTWLHAARARISLLLGRDAAESRMEEEFRFHVDMESDRLMREEGLEPEEARRRARVAFGGAERYREELRGDRGFDWLKGLSLDLRLGLRMLFKYPGLTVVGGLGMAVAIAIAAVAFGIIYAMMDPSLPLDEGDRIVMLQNYDVQRSSVDRAAHLHDLQTFRRELTTVEDLGAFRTVERNLMSADGGAELLRLAEMTASGFELARVPPLLGRPLLPSDERSDAEPVVVIGEDVWRNRFAADAGILGRTIRLGETSHIVVGVMPAGFRFPTNHEYWVPLTPDPTDYRRGAAPQVQLFGRLAPTADLERARAEMATVGRRLQATYPDVYEHIRPQVVQYAYAFFDIDTPAMAASFHLIVVLISLLLVVVSVNVAVLNYARTATRTGEITVRTALGASRRRVIAQLFAEAFVLSVAAAVVGLTIAAFVLERVSRLMWQGWSTELPFWFDPGMSAGMAAYVGGLALLAGVIIGVLPALKATGSHIQAGLRNLGSGSSSVQLGRAWTLMIVLQVAIAVAVLPAAAHNAIESARSGTVEPGYPADEYLKAWLEMERPPAPAVADADTHERELDADHAQAVRELIRRLETEPAVSAATFARVPPGREHRIRIEIGNAQHIVQYGLVDPGFLDAFGVPLLAGRPFFREDAAPSANTVIVNRSFAQLLPGGGDALGRVVRYPPGRSELAGVERDRPYEIIGVVEDFPNPARRGEAEPRIYHAVSPGALPLVSMIVRVRGTDVAGYSKRLRGLATETDVRLRMSEPAVIAQADRDEQSVMRMVAAGVLVATLSVILLSAAGIYSMMSFTVARRRREIGIRAALGAEPRRLLTGVFTRAATQLGAGVLLGLALAAMLDMGIDGEYIALLPVVALFMVTVGLFATLGPARHALRIQPTEALRQE